MILHTALFIEAKEIIKCFGLKKYEDENFLIYSNKDIVLIISGIGKINAAIALSHALTLFPNHQKIVSFGIAAGKKELEIGELVNIKKIIDLEENKVFHLKEIESLKNVSLATSLAPQKTPKADLGDMEASALYQVAKKYKKDLVILKVVSDHFLPEKVVKTRVDKLILKNINNIKETITKN